MYTFIDGVVAMGKSVNLPVVDVFVDNLTTGLLGLDHSLTKGSHLVDKLSVRDMDRTATANFLQLREVELRIVIISSTFAKIWNEMVPSLFLARILLLHVECGLAARDPGEVVQGGAATQCFPPCVWLLDTFVVVAPD
jgi:hypothetical protein